MRLEHLLSGALDNVLKVWYYPVLLFIILDISTVASWWPGDRKELSLYALHDEGPVAARTVLGSCKMHSPIAQLVRALH